MRYQLRYIRAQRTRSSPGAKDDDSPRERAHTNLLVWAVSRLSRHPYDAHVARTAEAWLVLVFDLVRLSAPVPWLSGRASASHAEGRWFDPSRDHSPDLHEHGVCTLWLVRVVRFLSGDRWFDRFGCVESVEVGRDLVELV